MPCDASVSAVVYHKARALSSYLIRQHVGYDVHGLFGIFAEGARIANSSKRHFLDYGGVKTAFLINEVCARSTTTTICEVGFCAGLSALLFLEAAPTATVWSFDLGDLPWSRAANARLAALYTYERFPGVVFGDAALTMRRALGARRCDVAFVDGAKTYHGRLASLRSLRAVAAADATVFLDEVTTEACVNGSYASQLERRCARLNPGYWPSVRAYNTAVREGWLVVERCVWPTIPFDGICRARFS